MIKPVPRHPDVPEEDLINLNDETYSTSNHQSGSGGYKPNGNNGRKEVKRKTGFSKRPGSKSRSNTSGSAGTANEDYVDSEDEEEWEEEEWVPDVFLFEYGTVVIWGMTEREEKAFLKSL